MEEDTKGDQSVQSETWMPSVVNGSNLVKTDVDFAVAETWMHFFGGIINGSI